MNYKCWRCHAEIWSPEELERCLVCNEPLISKEKLDHLRIEAQIKLSKLHEELKDEQ